MNYYAKRFFGQQGIVTDGLKLWLDASNPASYPGTGTTWFDLSGNGNNATMINGLATTIDSTTVMNFIRSSQQYAIVPTPFTQLPITISYWVKFKTIVNQGAFVCRKYIGTGVSIFHIISSASLNTRFDVGFIGTQVMPLLKDVWYNVTFVASGTVKVYYLNGVAQYSENGTFSATDIHVLSTIGASNVFGATIDNCLDGKLGEIEIYSKALSSTEVLKNFNATKSKYGL